MDTPGQSKGVAADSILGSYLEENPEDTGTHKIKKKAWGRRSSAMWCWSPTAVELVGLGILLESFNIGAA
eukprot:2645009-Prorocentrum_lima.AAC.1